MRLKEFLKLNGKTMEQFCKDHKWSDGKPWSYGMMKQYSSGHAHPSPPRAAEIEEATGGQVTRFELLYPDEIQFLSQTSSKTTSINSNNLRKSVRTKNVTACPKCQKNGKKKAA